MISIILYVIGFIIILLLFIMVFVGPYHEPIKMIHYYGSDKEGENIIVIVKSIKLFHKKYCVATYHKKRERGDGTRDYWWLNIQTGERVPSDRFNEILSNMAKLNTSISKLDNKFYLNFDI